MEEISEAVQRFPIIKNYISNAFATKLESVVIESMDGHYDIFCSNVARIASLCIQNENLGDYICNELTTSMIKSSPILLLHVLCSEEISDIALLHFLFALLFGSSKDEELIEPSITWIDNVLMEIKQKRSPLKRLLKCKNKTLLIKLQEDIETINHLLTQVRLGKESTRASKAGLIIFDEILEGYRSILSTGIISRHFYIPVKRILEFGESCHSFSGDVFTKLCQSFKRDFNLQKSQFIDPFLEKSQEPLKIMNIISTLVSIKFEENPYNEGIQFLVYLAHKHEMVEEILNSIYYIEAIDSESRFLLILDNFKSWLNDEAWHIQSQTLYKVYYDFVLSIIGLDTIQSTQTYLIGESIVHLIGRNEDALEMHCQSYKDIQNIPSIYYLFERILDRLIKPLDGGIDISPLQYLINATNRDAYSPITQFLRIFSFRKISIEVLSSNLRYSNGIDFYHEIFEYLSIDMAVSCFLTLIPSCVRKLKKKCALTLSIADYNTNLLENLYCVLSQYSAVYGEQGIIALTQESIVCSINRKDNSVHDYLDIFSMMYYKNSANTKNSWGFEIWVPQILLKSPVFAQILNKRIPLESTTTLKSIQLALAKLTKSSLPNEIIDLKKIIEYILSQKIQNVSLETPSKSNVRSVFCRKILIQMIQCYLESPDTILSLIEYLSTNAKDFWTYAIYEVNTLKPYEIWASLETEYKEQLKVLTEYTKFREVFAMVLNYIAGIDHFSKDIKCLSPVPKYLLELSSKNILSRNTIDYVAVEKYVEEYLANDSIIPDLLSLWTYIFNLFLIPDIDLIRLQNMLRTYQSWIPASPLEDMLRSICRKLIDKRKMTYIEYQRLTLSLYVLSKTSFYDKPFVNLGSILHYDILCNIYITSPLFVDTPHILLQFIHYLSSHGYHDQLLNLKFFKLRILWLINSPMTKGISKLALSFWMKFVVDIRDDGLDAPPNTAIKKPLQNTMWDSNFSVVTVQISNIEIPIGIWLDWELKAIRDRKSLESFYNNQLEWYLSILSTVSEKNEGKVLLKHCIFASMVRFYNYEPQGDDANLSVIQTILSHIQIRRLDIINAMHTIPKDVIDFDLSNSLTKALALCLNVVSHTADVDMEQYVYSISQFLQREDCLQQWNLREILSLDIWKCIVQAESKNGRLMQTLIDIISSKNGVVILDTLNRLYPLLFKWSELNGSSRILELMKGLFLNQGIMDMRQGVEEIECVQGIISYDNIFELFDNLGIENQIPICDKKRNRIEDKIGMSKRTKL